LPLRSGFLDKVIIEAENKEEDPVFMKRLTAWRQKRIALEKQSEPGSSGMDKKSRWCGSYVKGQDVAGVKYDQHRNVFKCNSVRDKRKKTG